MKSKERLRKCLGGKADERDVTIKCDMLTRTGS